MQSIISNASHTPTYNTIPTSKIPQSTVSHATYINSSTSISEPIKPFDGLDHNYTQEEYLQHIEARVTFSLGLQQYLFTNSDSGTLDEWLLFSAP